MANFAGLLKKTIDAQENPTPQLRARVYARARETVERKLAETNVPEGLAQQQLKALDDAIKSVEANYVAVEQELLSTIIVKAPEEDQSSPLKEAAHALEKNDSVKIAEKTQPAGYPEDKAKQNKDDFVTSEEKNDTTAHKADRSDEADPSGKKGYSATSVAPNEAEKTATSASNTTNASKLDDLAGEAKTSAIDDSGAADEINKDSAQSNISSTSKTVPNAEPVNMEAIIAAEKEAQNEQLENEAKATKALANNQQNGDYNIVSDIFVQAARRTERRAARKRVIVVGLSIAAVVIIVVGVLFTAWSFLSNKNKSDSGERHIAETNNSEQPKEKYTQRLLADGSEVDEGPAKTEVKPGEGTSTSTGTAGVNVPQEQRGEAILYRARTDADEEKVATGSVEWSLIKDEANAGHPEEIAVRGNVTIPNEKLSLRLTLRRNTDPSLLAAYLIEAIFIVPDDFEGKAIDSVKELTFKDSEQSPGQQLDRTVEARIDDNFFLFALSDSNPFRDRNLRLMKQLGWMRFVITDKNNRIFELTFSKGATGEAIFNQVIDTWLNQNKKPTFYDLQQQKSGQSDDATNTENGAASQPGEATTNGQIDATGEQQPDGNNTTDTDEEDTE